MFARRAPLAAPPPAYAFVTRVYKRSLRPIVLIMAIVASIWSLALAVEGFKELATDENDNFPKLAPLAIVQGVLYTVALLFQLVGVTAAVTQRVKLIRLYAYLCALSALFAVGVGLMRVVTHFTYKSDLISECEAMATSGTVDGLFGFWGTAASNLTPLEATSYCNDMWNRGSWAEILLTILLIVLGLLFTSIAFAYYRQAIDPTSPVNAFRTPSDQYRMGGYPAQPYDTAAPMYSQQKDGDGGGQPPQYPYGDYTMFGPDGKHDAFGDSTIHPPMPTHWAEERDVTMSGK